MQNFNIDMQMEGIMRIGQVKLALDQHAALNVSKTTLANAMNKVPYSQNGYTGNPNVGFVRKMYTPTYFFEIRVSVIYATFAEVVFFIVFFLFTTDSGIIKNKPVLKGSLF